MSPTDKPLSHSLKQLRALQAKTFALQSRLKAMHHDQHEHIQAHPDLLAKYQGLLEQSHSLQTYQYSLQELEQLQANLQDAQKSQCSAQMLKYAGIAALIGSLLDLALVGDTTEAIGKGLFTALGAPTEHLSSSPKVPFDKMLDRSFEATGNHRWNSLSHHPTLVGLFTAISDTLSGTSTHIVDAEVVNVVSTNATLERSLKNSPLKNPEAWMIEKVLWSIGTVLAHWWSDVNTNLGLPGPFSTLVKCVEQGEFEYGGHQFNLADVSYELYRDGLDFRRYVADGIVPLSINLFIRWCAWHEAIHTEQSKGEAIKAAIHLSPEFQQALLIAHTLCAGCNLTKVCLTGNPLLINVSQWLSLSRQGLKFVIKKQANHRSKEQKETAKSIQESKTIIEQLQRLNSKQKQLQAQAQSSAGRSHPYTKS